MFKRSMHVRNGSDPMREKPALPAAMRLRAAWLSWQADQETCRQPGMTEELVLLARRPLGT